MVVVPAPTRVKAPVLASIVATDTLLLVYVIDTGLSLVATTEGLTASIAKVALEREISGFFPMLKLIVPSRAPPL